MKTLLILGIFIFSSEYVRAQQMKGTLENITLVIHGGAGNITKESMTPEREAAYKAKLDEALNSGFEILETGGTSIEAVIAAIKILEDSPLFNAGKGAVFTHEGENEMDASIMEGENHQAGAVAGVSTIKNPIEAAFAVMKDSPHVLLTGEGAEAFAEEQELELVSPTYFYTEDRFQQLQRIIKSDSIKLDHSGNENGQGNIKSDSDNKFGTVGAVALDKFGNLAAGTSTGGMTNKRFGRVGDSPIIGAGTYADNETCAVSATGHGEFFIREVVAYDITALMKYKGMSVKEAAEKVVMEKLVKIKGDGGVIALDNKGNVAMPFNTKGMFRGYKKRNKAANVFLYKH
jgi:L-asparaginase / beta-aspartyl-peptidase